MQRAQSSWTFVSIILLVLVVHPQIARALAAAPSSCGEGNFKQAVTAEVVGGAGRVGSLLLSSTTRAVPKGVVPGHLSLPDTPIYVATAAREWPSILQCTPPDRREDLIWMGNGLAPTPFCGTAVVPHFGVLEVNSDPVTSPISPPTFLYGKHAQVVQECMMEKGIQTQIVDTYQDIQSRAAQKLLWASSLWLLCHQEEAPRTVVDILDEELEALVREELFPALCARLPELTKTTALLDCNACLEYLKRYSQSMPHAIPNRELCSAEWKERNAFFLAVREQVPQPRHEALLRQVGGISTQEIKDIVAQSPSDKDNSEQRVVEIPSLDLAVLGNHPLSPAQGASPSKNMIQSAIIVGGGILGSSVALHLARQGIQVQVVDVQSTQDLGKTTPASWAWLNANGKSPPEYAWLNQLGMHGWRTDPLLRHLPTWTGALVRFAKRQTMLGGYRVEGPLSEERLQALEPAADLYHKDHYCYFFPDEGFVDPSVAVRTLREEAARLGVTFKGNVNVTGFIRDHDSENQHDNKSKIIGVRAVAAGNDDDGGGSVFQLHGDVVVLAAGVGMTGLGNIPLLHRPGQIAFAKPSSEREQSQQVVQRPSLQRILVDTVRETHVLQRQDGNFVTGGGALEVGGKGTAALQTAGMSKDSALSADDTLLGRARQVLPGMIGELLRSEQAVRPIPLDGLPVVGYIEESLYAVVTHSGVTLSPILGALAATEIANGMAIQTLEPFRPTRFV